MAGNTEILIKRSLSTNTPSVLVQGELAYSYSSNTLFIGTPGSDGAIEIAHFSDLTHLSAGVYGDATHIPILTVDGHGTVTNVTTSEISTTLSLEADNGMNTMSLLTGTLAIDGGIGITSSIDGSTITLDVDDTVVRSNTESVGPQHISTDVSISGNLTVQGTTTYVQSQINQTNDALIELAANNTVGDVVDIGFYGKHEGISGTVITGLVRNAGTSDYYLFDNIALDGQANLTSNLITQGDMSANGASLYGKQFLASQGVGSTGGYSFSGNEGGLDSGMFSPTDGQIDFYSNTNRIFGFTDGTYTHYTAVTFNAGGATLHDTSNHSLLFGTGVQDTGSSNRISIGYQPDSQSGQSWDAIAIGARAGTTNQSDNAIAIGNRAGNSGQSESAVAIGGGSGGSGGAGQDNQGWSAVAIGNHAAVTNQGSESVAIGSYAGQGTQGQQSVAIGPHAGQNSQSNDSVAVGYYAGQNSQQYAAVAIGREAGTGDTTSQGQYSVAIGYRAGYDHQHDNSIALNASGNQLNPDNSGFYVDPIRNEASVAGNVAVYNSSTKEVTYTNVKVDAAGITLANGTIISDADSGLFIDSIREDATVPDILYYNSDTKEVSYGTIADIRADVLSNNQFSWTISGDNGSLTSNVGTSIAASANSVVIGENVDVTNANYGRVAIGIYAGTLTQAAEAVAIGDSAGYNNQGSAAVALGYGAGNVNQGMETVAIGLNAGNSNQNQHAIAIGADAGNSGQGISAIAIGQDAGATSQSFSGVAIGRYAGQTSQGWDSVAVGRRAGRTSQGSYSVAFGWAAANNLQGAHSVAIGESAGSNTQSAFAAAVGSQAGNELQGWGAVAFGTQAGYQNQGLVAVAIGSNAGRYTQSQGAVAVGRRSGETTQGYYATALGNRAGRSNQGQYALALGAYAGDTNQAAYSIVLNASGSALNGSTSGLFINPVAYTATQDATYDGLMFYNANTKEVRYSYVLDGGAF